MNTNRMVNQNFLRKISIGLVSAAVLFAMTAFAKAQEPIKVVKPNYAQAERYSSKYLRQFVYDSSVRPNWIGKSDKFWYSYRTSAGTKYHRVDPAHATKEDLFDHGKLASLLSELIRKPLDSTRLPLTRVEIEDDGSAIKFVIDKLQYQYNLEDETLVKLGKAPPAPASSRFGRRGQRIVEEKKDEEKDEKEKDDEKKDVNKEQDKQKKTKTKKKEDSDEKNKSNTSNQKGETKAGDDKKDAGKNDAGKTDENDKTVDKKDELKNKDTNSSKKKRTSKQKKETVKDADKTKGKVEEKQGEKSKKETDEKTTKSADKEKETKKPQTDHRAFSPDRTAYVYTKGYDLYFVELPEGYKYEAPKSKKDDDKKESDNDSKDDGAKKEKTKDDGVTSDGDTKKSGDADKDKSEQKVDAKTEEMTDAAKKKKANRKKRAARKKNAKKGESDDAGKTSQSKQKQKQDVKGKDDEDKGEDGKGDKDKDGKKKKDEVKKQEDKKVKTEKSKDADEKEDGDEDEKEKELPIPEIGPDLDDTAIRLSDDGEEKFGFKGRSRFSRSRGTTKSKEELEKAKTQKSKPSVVWSKDSKAFYVSRRDSRKVKELFVINSLSTPRPTLEQYAYSMPGEENVSISHSYYLSRDDKKLVELKPKWKNETIRGAHWKKEGHQLRFVRSDRLLRNVEFCELDLSSGDVTCLVADGFEAANISVQDVRYMKDTDEMIWFSERSGWAHFYLYDLDGNLKNPITSGEYRASRIVDIDEKNRLVYFTGNAREPGENIYQNHLYCVRLDGTGLQLLDPGDANHRSTLSKSKKYLVDNCSRVDMAPISVLRDAQGNVIMKLEESDMSRLKEVGWKMPNTFVVKAADGVTDLYGNIWKPFDFDPSKQYPIIAHVYPGPQMEGTSHSFSATAGNQQLAQLGFVVIQVGHRGGTPQRSKAYHSYGYFNLRDYGLADKKAAIEQLGQRFPWIDVERVGIYGHSGGGFMTAAALLREPYNQFFKVGVSTAGNHDNNIYNSSWSERYHGLKEVPVVDSKKTGSSNSQNSSSRTNSSRTNRSGAPDTAGAYSAFSSEESDFFYEHEGFLNEDGELESSSNHDIYDGPRAFQRQDTDGKTKKESDQEDGDSKDVQDDKEVKKKSGKDVKTKKEGDDKSDKSTEKEDDDSKSDKSTGKKDEDSEKEAKKKTRFEIKIPTNAELAGNLNGHLFLIHGESDNNVHPANTLRLVDALIKADKRFDMLYLPGTRHGFGSYQPYVTQRMYEYFAEHLLNDYQSGADMKDRKKAREFEN